MIDARRTDAGTLLIRALLTYRQRRFSQITPPFPLMAQSVISRLGAQPAPRVPIHEPSTHGSPVSHSGGSTRIRESLAHLPAGRVRSLARQEPARGLHAHTPLLPPPESLSTGGTEGTTRDGTAGAVGQRPGWRRVCTRTGRRSVSDGYFDATGFGFARDAGSEACGGLETMGVSRPKGTVARSREGLELCLFISWFRLRSRP